ncbi:sugar ABC transporter substrate-binding protein [Cellulomonas sp. P22]
MILATAALAASGLLLAGCSNDSDSSGDGSGTAGGSSESSAAKVGVILPDSKSSARWETADRKYLEEAFQAAGVDYDIQNAQGDKTQFQTIADQMITSGVNVLMIVNLDSGSGKAVLSKAQAQGISTIDYDRLTLGGGADFYVSFDNVAVGNLQGEGLEKCLTDAGTTTANIVYLNGSPTDNNATLFKQGAVEALQPQIDSGAYTVVADQAVPDWDNQQAGTIFEQMWTDQGGNIDGVLAANDGLGNAAIAILKKNGVNGTVPVTGQDATDQGLQNVLAGDQCMTVYKAVKKEADAAAALAVALATGADTADLAPDSVTDSESGEDVQAVLLEPEAIYFDNVKDVIADGYTTVENVCTAELADKCAEAGIS